MATADYRTCYAASVRETLGPAIALIRNRVSDLVAIYLFGSFAQQQATPRSDIDLAYLAPQTTSTTLRWDLQQDLAVLLHQDVDLIDLRASSTVLRANVLEHSELLLDLDSNQRALFEATALGAYARLNFARRHILADIRRSGRIYG